MNNKKIFLTTLVALVAFATILTASADERGCWTYYQYSDDIAVGDGINQFTVHRDAGDAYAVLVSSSGKCTLEYEWDYPYFSVCISNDDTQTISVTWREYFYET